MERLNLPVVVVGADVGGDVDGDWDAVMIAMAMATMLLRIVYGRDVGVYAKVECGRGNDDDGGKGVGVCPYYGYVCDDAIVAQVVEFKCIYNEIELNNTI